MRRHLIVYVHHAPIHGIRLKKIHPGHAFWIIDFCFKIDWYASFVSFKLYGNAKGLTIVFLSQQRKNLYKNVFVAAFECYAHFFF